jgi:hypothetical protein
MHAACLESLLPDQVAAVTPRLPPSPLLQVSVPSHHTTPCCFCCCSLPLTCPLACRPPDCWPGACLAVLAWGPCQCPEAKLAAWVVARRQALPSFCSS